MPHRARQHAHAWELQKQGNIHTSDDVITGTSVFRARVGGYINPIARGHDARITTPPHSEDLAEYLNELWRIYGSREADRARVFSALNDEIRHASDPALRRLCTSSADVLLRLRRV